MKKISLPVVLMMLMFSARQTPLFAQDAHANFLYYGYADARGRVVVTRDNQKVYKFWNLEDGKPLFSFNAGDPDLNAKMLIYNVQDDEWQKRNMEVKTSFHGSVSIARYFIDGKNVAEKGLITVEPVYSAMHYRTRRIALKITSKGVSDIMLIKENPSDASHPTIEQLASIPDSAVRIYSIEFSPSGRYLYSSGGCLVDVDEKKLLWNDVNWHKKYDFSGYHVAFSKDESQLGMVNEKGMKIIDVATGTVTDSIDLPQQFKKYPNISLFPCADMQTFLVTETCYSPKKTDCSKKAWLVKKDKVIQLVASN